MHRYVVGIDLGTTNSTLAYADLRDPERGIVSFPVPQLVGEGTVAERPALPSFLYLGGEIDLTPGALALPWDPERTYAVGELARIQGARVPGHLISSAKSWLCHGGVDRESPILPWAASEDVEKISPVEASARYLQHFREAWVQRFPDAPLEEQDVILTVPASFDEVARELTVQAAENAGLTRIVLLEEPQAACYAWIHAHAKDWRERLAGVESLLVVDIGGGTTDFSLVAVHHEEGETGLERLAVGDHLLLGGDNIDVALARTVEPRLGVKLDSQRWHALTLLCRQAKEELLATEAPDEVPIRLVGRGAAVVGGAVSATLRRDELLDVVLHGFFPRTAPDDLPRRTARVGLQEWGLPFAVEAETPRHLAAFLRAHRDDPRGDFHATAPYPDALLFNGGALKPDLLRHRLRDLLADWRGGDPPTVLESADLDLAVARGAAYYGLVRRGLGVRIGGGSPRAYYLGVADGTASENRVKVICVVPRGLHEGEEVEISEPEFNVRANQAVSFPLYSSSTRLGDAAGALLEAERDTLTALPPLRTVLRFGRKLAARTLPAHIGATLTEVGTLDIWCRSLQTDHRWRLQFALRDLAPVEEEDKPAERQSDAALEINAERVKAAAEPVRAVFPAHGESRADPVGLTRELESALAAGKDAWPLDAIRALWDVLWEGELARGKSEAHEARWLNLAGFLLRPGFGHELDEWRVQNLWRLITPGPKFPRAVQCRVEWWNMWKRIAGGLSRPQQQELFNRTAPHLLPRLKSKIRDKRLVGPQEIREYWQLLASCERLAAGSKAELGERLLPSVAKGKATEPEIWALGRFGARQPFHGPLNCVVDPQTVGAWIERLLGKEWKRPQAVVFATVQMARCVGDRARDLDEGLRRRLAERLRDMPAGERAARVVLEPVPIEAQERARILDESLPIGLELRDEPVR